MKKVLLFVFAIGLLTSCATSAISYPEPYGFSTFLDYSPLTNKGIYVTESNSVSFDYKTLGSVSATEVSGWVKKEKVLKVANKNKKNNVDDMYADVERNQSNGKYMRMSPSLDVAMERMANTLKEVDANGIINLKIRWEPDRIIISGMAIRK
ncbi:hypothetical protein PO397_22980 [Bacteroides ovatus]|jgi:uncharacterized protein YbjQ (UPF0145 family)|uniref:hypothetical protein n=1 Tax=Bacteroides ovatus TaxID=28116 RepID=UPI000EE1B0BA|nr:hypothetical protein [Bacteroides ovatus]DAK70830.1 MAG TPA: Selenium binding protein, Selenium-Binding Protein [Caudoviricetes sp.]MDC2772802.1 hypothetical protein [Bacteroides ovatus]MDC2784534.1 hypothetical protein [Bacteroides ovatus]MDC2789468.1 hypothetical protein [Bacteroides ovatus]MDC2794282.1 hypothetical protein [Bacteroides ovatus]